LSAARGQHANSNLARPGFRQRFLDGLEDVGVAVPGDDDSLVRFQMDSGNIAWGLVSQCTRAQRSALK
jgi:hypothetical protein